MERLPGIVDQAKLSDAESIKRLVKRFADDGKMLHREVDAICNDIDDYLVCRVDNEIVGCAALHRLSDNLAEIRAVAVREEDQKRGIGTSLVLACLEKAQALGVPKILLLTYEPGYFGRFGFKRGKIETFPDKLYGECSTCPKGPPSECSETAMVHHL